MIQRLYGSTSGLDTNKLPVSAGSVIEKGHALGSVNGYLRPLVAGDNFAGFSEVDVDNTNGLDGDKEAKVKASGFVQGDVTGALVSSLGAPVFMADAITLTLDNGGGANTQIGKVTKFVQGSECKCSFAAFFV